MMNRLRRALNRVTRSRREFGLLFERPLVLFQSDDWGRVGVRDRVGWEELRASGISLGESPYDSYSLETEGDLEALAGVLHKHRDSADCHPTIGMNFILANVDFESASTSQNDIPLIPLTAGLPGRWERPGLFAAYRRGFKEGVFIPALHGLTHFCSRAVKRELDGGGERSQLIRKLWKAQTPYIHWRMPWIGYEYWDPERDPDERFLALADQRTLVRTAADIFQEFFGETPTSACAPGYRANNDTAAAWQAAGIKVAQHGPGDAKHPYLDDQGMLHTFRTLEMEPATAACDIESVVSQAKTCFDQGLPVVVSVHSINFHSTIRDFCAPTLALLDHFLRALEEKWPDILYVSDAELFSIAIHGNYRTRAGKKIDVRALHAGANS